MAPAPPHRGFPDGSDGKEHVCQCRRQGFHPWVGKIPWRRKRQPAPVFLPGEAHRQRNLVGYSPLGCKELDTTGRLGTHTLPHQGWGTAPFLYPENDEDVSILRHSRRPNRTAIGSDLKYCRMPLPLPQEGLCPAEGPRRGRAGSCLAHVWPRGFQKRSKSDLEGAPELVTENGLGGRPGPTPELHITPQKLGSEICISRVPQVIFYLARIQTAGLTVHTSVLQMQRVRWRVMELVISKCWGPAEQGLGGDWLLCR